ncbi:MAG TPA: protein kinase [Thermoanaerobaculia bacterium]|nr:protein kinase [Thermoanaerobaculia bacterium]
MEEKSSLSRIGKYEILDKIGEGGFGVVYKGRDPFIKRLVAVKTCSSENQQVQQRFFREAEIAGNLHHANVVTIHDFGIEGETPYLVQEFLTGEDLDVLIKEGFESLPLPTKVRYLRGIADGLRYAHSQGVIHRDIKPANIRVLENGRVKVMDFGIAKLKDQESQLTQTGMALGTVAYMSPEQLRGEKIDHRVDIFSYGVLAYELLAGKRPFRAETVSTLFYQLLHEPPPPMEMPHLPAQLVAVVDRCLSKSVEERYQSFDEVIAALDQVAAEITGAEDLHPEDLFRPGAQSEAESSAHRLAAKALRSIDAGDLTAAAMTINMARREVDQATFERVFGSVLAAFQELEHRQAASAAAGPRLDDPAQLLSDVEIKLLADDYQGAEAALSRLEAQMPGDPRVRSLRQRFTAGLASRPTAPGTESSSAVGPPPPQSMAHAVEYAALEPPTLQPSRGLGRLPIAIAAGTVAMAAIGLLVWVLTSSPESDAGEAGDGEQERVGESLEDGAGTTGTPDTSGTLSSAGPGGADESGAPGSGVSPNGGDQSSISETSPRSSDAGRGTAATPTGEAASDGTRTPASTSASTTPSNDPARVTTPTGTGNQGQPNRPPDRPTTTDSRTRPDRPGASDSGGGPGASDSDRATGPGTGATTDRAAEERREDRTPPETTPAVTTPTVTTPAIDIADLREQDAIRRTLIAFQNAWKSLDHNAINTVHPAAGLTRRDVRNYRLADVSFRDCSFNIQSERATASCQVTRTLEPRDGSNAQVERFAGFRLVRRGSAWEIESLLPGG